jgi:hypothetical protein
MFVTGKHKSSIVLLELLLLRNSFSPSAFQLHCGLRMSGRYEVVQETFAVGRTDIKNLRQAT